MSNTIKPFTGCNRVIKPLKNLLKCEAGNISLLFALLFPVSAVAVGGAIDFSLLHTKRMKIERAADAATTGSISDVRANIDELTRDEIPAYLEKSAYQIFSAEMNGENLDNIEFDVKVTYEKQVIEAEISYNLVLGTSFLALIGMDTVEIGGVSVSKSSLGSYRDFNIVVNVSNSMGVGASQSDIDYMLENYTHEGKACAFACHTTIDEVRELPVKIRLDAANDAIKIALDHVETNKHPDSKIRFGLYTYATELTEVFDASNPNSQNLNFIRDEVSKSVQLSTEDNSRMDNSLDLLANHLGFGGDGFNQNDPAKYALVITDGVQWISPQYPEYDRFAPGANFSWGRAQVPNALACDRLKEQNITVYFIYTTYIPIFNRSEIDGLSRRIERNVLSINRDAMKACASDEDKFIEASDADELEEAVKKIFNEVSIPTHLAN